MISPCDGLGFRRDGMYAPILRSAYFGSVVLNGLGVAKTGFGKAGAIHDVGAGP